jgi:hypothetical protein
MIYKIWIKLDRICIIKLLIIFEMWLIVNINLFSFDIIIKYKNR